MYGKIQNLGSLKAILAMHLNYQGPVSCFSHPPVPPGCTIGWLDDCSILCLLRIVTIFIHSCFSLGRLVFLSPPKRGGRQQGSGQVWGSESSASPSNLNLLLIPTCSHLPQECLDDCTSVFRLSLILKVSLLPSVLSLPQKPVSEG